MILSSDGFHWICQSVCSGDWNDCMQGDIERDLASATAGYHSALSSFLGHKKQWYA